MALVELRPEGLYCPNADVYIDPWRAVPKAFITHAHSDHARYGCTNYFSSAETKPLLKARLGSNIDVTGFDWREAILINGIKFSFHHAGHIPGSAQIRIEFKGEVCVVSGDYKLENDGISGQFEPITCHSFITESTFGLPIFKWKPQAEIFNEINLWWSKNADENICSFIFAYSLGKAQRILQYLDQQIGPVYTHAAVNNMNEVVQSFVPHLAKSKLWSLETDKSNYRKALVIAPPAAAGSTWMNNFKPYSSAVASGWMNLRGAKRRSNVDRGFVLSDHADWTALNNAIDYTNAEQVFVTHGYTASFSKWLNEQGKLSFELKTLYEGESLIAGGEVE